MLILTYEEETEKAIGNPKNRNQVVWRGGSLIRKIPVKGNWILTTCLSGV